MQIVPLKKNHFVKCNFTPKYTKNSKKIPKTLVRALNSRLGRSLVEETTASHAAEFIRVEKNT